MLSTDIQTAKSYFALLAQGGTVAMIHPAYMKMIVAMMDDWGKRARAMENIPVPLILQLPERKPLSVSFDPGRAS